MNHLFGDGGLTRKNDVSSFVRVLLLELNGDWKLSMAELKIAVTYT
jgi:hypothetical protein